MALFECPECGRSISDKARTCPGCGALVELIKPKPEVSEPENENELNKEVKKPVPQPQQQTSQTIDVRIIDDKASKKQKNRGFILLFIAAGISVFYLAFSFPYWFNVSSTANGIAEEIGTGIATLAVLPHLLCATLATIFNVVVLFTGGSGLTLASAILYAVSAFLFPMYFMFVLIQTIFGFIAYAMKKKKN